MTQDYQEKAAQAFDDLAANIRAGEIRVSDWCVTAETREGDNGTWVTVEPTGAYRLTVRYQKKPAE